MASSLDNLERKYGEILAKEKAIRKKLDMLRQEQNRQARKQARKARNQLLFQVGGLAEIADLLHTDKGALLGALLSVSDDLNAGPDSVKFQEWKLAGDKVLQEREKARKS